MSKKSVTAPMNSCFQFGQPAQRARACLYQKALNATPTIARTTKRGAFPLIASILTRIRRRVPLLRAARGRAMVQMGGGGQMLSVVMMAPVPVTQPVMQTLFTVSHTCPTILQAQKTCWLQLLET